MIACEGEKTEPNYLSELRGHNRCNKTQVRLITKSECKATDPLGLVKGAKQIWRTVKKEGLEYDQVWCVFDRDEHATYDQAIEYAARNKIKVAISNPCFELWYFLHFQNQTAHIERDRVVHNLGAHIPDYEKSKTGIYEFISARQDDACKRAEQLREKHKGDGNSECENPSTGVDRLIAVLNQLKKRRSQ